MQGVTPANFFSERLRRLSEAIVADDELALAVLDRFGSLITGVDSYAIRELTTLALSHTDSQLDVALLRSLADVMQRFGGSESDG